MSNKIHFYFNKIDRCLKSFYKPNKISSMFIFVENIKLKFNYCILMIILIIKLYNKYLNNNFICFKNHL